jgi:hypothetical protein
MKAGYTITDTNFLGRGDILEAIIVFNYFISNEVHHHFASFTPNKDTYSKPNYDVVGIWKVKQLKN